MVVTWWIVAFLRNVFVNSSSLYSAGDEATTTDTIVKVGKLHYVLMKENELL